jgi:Ca-activated chloride channel homolog
MSVWVTTLAAGPGVGVVGAGVGGGGGGGARFQNPEWLWAGLLVCALAVVLVWAGWRRRRAIRQFLGVGAEEGGRAWMVRGLKGWALVLATGFVVLSVARPQSDPQEQKVSVSGRDVVFLVDVSRSMLAQDVKPSRLERTKLWIKDLASTLQGDRVGLVAFAGASSVKCPMTLDYGFFTLAVDELSPRSVPRGGTLIGDAIRKTLTDLFGDQPGTARDIVLITDGEDHESFPVEAARHAAELGVRIIAIGIGSDEGAAVPEGEKGGGSQGVEFEGRQVRSKLEAGTLSQIAQASAKGVFLNVGTGTIDLDTVYHQLVDSAEKMQREDKAVVRYREHYQWLLGAALLLLAMDAVLVARSRL